MLALSHRRRAAAHGLTLTGTAQHLGPGLGALSGQVGDDISALAHRLGAGAATLLRRLSTAAGRLGWSAR